MVDGYERLRVAAIVVVFRTPEPLLERCIESVRVAANSADCDVDIIIADNGGTYTPELMELADIWCDTGSNLGFGVAVNLAIRRAVAPLTLLVNPDSRLEPLCLVELIQEHSRVALADAGPHKGTFFGCLLINGSRPQELAYQVWWSQAQHLLQRGNWRKWLERVIDQGAATSAPRLCGAGLFGSTQHLRTLGPFSDEFFLYGEDVDFSLRARAQGFSLVLVPKAVIRHDAGGSSEGVAQLVESARADAHLRLLARHQVYVVSLFGRLEFALGATVGLFAGARIASRSQARFRELRRWQLSRVADPLFPTGREGVS